MRSRVKATLFSAARHARLLAGVWALMVFAPATLAQGRLEPHERERLRHELREQAREDRHRMREQIREERHQSREPGLPREEARRLPMSGHEQGPRPVDAAGWRSDAREPARPDDTRPRMSPEEREALRVQLRERRRIGD